MDEATAIINVHVIQNPFHWSCTKMMHNLIDFGNLLGKMHMIRASTSKFAAIGKTIWCNGAKAMGRNAEHCVIWKFFETMLYRVT
jgi:hypothetical protein